MDPHGNPVDLFPAAPAWGMFLGSLGRSAVIASLVSLLAVLLLCFFNSSRTKQVQRGLFVLGSTAMVAAFASLIILTVKDQFQFQYVLEHSEKSNPLSYKFSATWTAQQGSLLLWASLTAVWGLLTYRRAGVYQSPFMGCFAVIIAALAGCLYYESPFNIMPDLIQKGVTKIPPDGFGMVPTLQNYWLVIHPPTMFAGFAALSVPFAYGVSAMVTGNVDDWVKQSRALTLTSVSVLGIGIVMGGLWAYETLGWGGFWAWDPVENTSLVPWLLVVVLAHGLIVQTARGIWKSANLLISGLPLITFAYGSLLTRTGLLDKVSKHSFATMDKGAVSILRYFVLGLFVAFLALYAFRGHKLAKQSQGDKAEEPGLNRTSMYQIGMLSLSLLAFVVALGMSWPVITALRGGEGASISEMVYHKAVLGFYVVFMLAMAIAPFVSWRSLSLSELGKRISTLLMVSVALTGVMLIVFKLPGKGLDLDPAARVDGLFNNTTLPQFPALAFVLLFCVFTAVANLWRIVEMQKQTKLGLGGFIAHFGIAVMLAGLIISKGFERKADVLVQEGRPGVGLGYTVSFKDYNPDRYFDRNNSVKFDVVSATNEKFTIDPTLYFYQQGEQEKGQTWPFIRREFTHDTYFFMQVPRTDVWEQPLSLKEGEEKFKDGITFKVIKQTREGEFGVAGTKFGAVVEISYTEENVRKTFQANPTMTLTGEGPPKPDMPPIGPEFRVTMVGMNANDKSMMFNLIFNPPLYPIQIFYKPLTILVWIGTGIFFLGGLIAAFYRRLGKGKLTDKSSTIIASSSEV